MKQKLNFAGILITALLVFAGCKKETAPLPPPIADAGNSQTIQLPVSEDQVSVTGSGTTTNGNIVGYLWSLVSGPNIPAITTPSSATTTINNIVAGTYILQFAVIDNAGLTGVDTVSLTVKPQVLKTLTIQPANNPNDTHTDSYNVTGGAGDTEIEIGTWTINGTAASWRTFIKFDQSQLPANATVLNATLSLYAMPVPHGGDLVSAHFGTDNSFYVERITGNWNPAAFTWNNQPVSTALNRVIVPQSGSAFENSTIDVTSILQDMQANANYGFAFRLQNEAYYNIRQYASSFHSNAALHPKLVITYQ